MARRRYQKGRVFLRGKNPVWVGRWREDVIGADERARRVERSTVLGSMAELPTMRLALRRLELNLAHINALDYRPGRVATVSEFAERWKAEVLSQHKPSTQKSATSHLKCHILPHLGELNLDEVGRERQQMFVTHLSQKQSRKTVLNILGTLSAMMNTAKNWGYICEGIKQNRLVLTDGGLRSVARFFSAEEARQIIAAAEEPFKTMFAVAAMTGIRAGELLGLQVDDLDFARRLVTIRRSVWRGQIQLPKSRASEAPVPIPEFLATTLRDYLKTWKPNPQQLLFINRRGRPFSANKVVQKKLWPILDALKIPRCGLHAFRHTHTSLLLEAGAPPTVAQAQLRHSDPRITLGIYGHVIGDSQRKAVEKVAECLRPIAPKTQPDGQWVH